MTVDLELPPITSLNAKGDDAARLDDPQVGDRFCVDYMNFTIERREDNGCLVRIEKPFGPRRAFILASSFKRWDGRGTNRMAEAGMRWEGPE